MSYFCLSYWDEYNVMYVFIDSWNVTEIAAVLQVVSISTY